MLNRSFNRLVQKRSLQRSIVKKSPVWSDVKRTIPRSSQAIMPVTHVWPASGPASRHNNTAPNTSRGGSRHQVCYACGLSAPLPSYARDNREFNPISSSRHHNAGRSPTHPPQRMPSQDPETPRRRQASSNPTTGRESCPYRTVR